MDKPLIIQVDNRVMKLLFDNFKIRSSNCIDYYFLNSGFMRYHSNSDDIYKNLNTLKVVNIKKAMLTRIKLGF